MLQAQMDTFNLGDLSNSAVEVEGSKQATSNRQLSNDNQIALAPNSVAPKKTVRKEYVRKKTTTANTPNRLEEDVEITLKISKKNYYLLEVLKDTTEESSIERLINKILKTKLKNLGMVVSTSEIVNELKQLSE